MPWSTLQKHSSAAEPWRLNLTLLPDFLSSGEKMSVKMKAKKKLDWKRSNTVHRKPLDVKSTVGTHCRRGGETSNIMEIFDKDHISWRSYPADVPGASSYLACRRRLPKDINYKPSNGTDTQKEIPVQSIFSCGRRREYSCLFNRHIRKITLLK